MQRKILIIDDDADIAESFKLILENKGYKVILAFSSEEGWQKVQSGPPDLILLDIMMPFGTEGFHFVWNLRKQSEERVSRIPIVVISSIHETTELRLYPEQADQTYRTGEYLPVQRFLDKPVHPDDLISTVKELLPD